ncbi:beta/gamma crystallin-related protein [Photobacterium piscicola]|uniref:beta/gamma crystallin-related protein n=1 Tax=Photobacterium piscicola TaxID=1378299 RepID=UPI003736B33B
MKKILFLTTLLGFSTASYADLHFEFKNVNNLNNNNGSNSGRVYVCTLQPFRDVFADVGITEDMARYKVQRRCEQSQGEGSIFCKAKEAKCVESSLISEMDTDRRNGISIYSKHNQRGESVMITHDVPNLRVYNFDNRMSSYDIPIGWKVRFYEGVNYSGGFYTRNSGDANAIGFDNQVSSIKILSTF